MTERWRRVSELFHAVLERPEGERDAFLAEVCAGDPSLREEVETLIATHERATAERFLEPPELSVLVGRAVGPYLVRDEIGRGGMGVVLRAEDTRLHRTVALKAISPLLARDERTRERLRREARAAAALSHPAVATVYALEEHDGELFIVSEFVPGRSLRAELADGPLPWPRLLETALAIADALAAAHALGIVHRDLKPENVLRRPDGQIKVVDFGLALVPQAAAETRLTTDRAALGTPGYMAPEQIRGGPVDARADVFAFGVLLYELATGRHPFGGDPAAAFDALLEGRTPPAWTPIQPPALDAIVRRCLRADPAQRYASAAALVEELRRLAAEPEGPARQTEVVGRAPRSMRWWWEFHQAALALAHAAMLALLWTGRSWFPRPYGAAVFYVGLVAATSEATMRLHLWFTSRFHPESLETQRARLFPWIAASDVLVAVLLAAAALRAAGADDGYAALCLAAAVASVLSLVVIEPATTRGAFAKRRARRRRT
jgi:serine/threonine-protein kinase